MTDLCGLPRDIVVPGAQISLWHLDEFQTFRLTVWMDSLVVRALRVPVGPTVAASYRRYLLDVVDSDLNPPQA